MTTTNKYFLYICATNTHFMKRRIGAVVIALGIIATFYVISTYLSISDKESLVYTLWADVERTCFDKARAINDIIITTERLPHNDKKLVELKEKLNGSIECIIGVNELTDESFTKFTNSQEAVNVALHNYMDGESWYTSPEIRTKKEMINKFDNRLLIGIEAYKNSAKDFNTYISRIRHKYIARLGDFKPNFFVKSSDGTTVK